MARRTPAADAGLPHLQRLYRRLAASHRRWHDVRCTHGVAAHDSLDLRTGRFAGCATASAWLEYWAGVADERVDARLADVWDRVGFGVPTHDPAAPGFGPRRCWRGPVWPVVNSLIDGGGFAEYFDPVDATPCGGDGFTWTAAVWLAWVRAGGSTVPT